MKWRIVVCIVALMLASRSHAAACPVTVGTLTLKAVVTRSSGISPLLVFFDATGTTDSAITGNQTVFQDVSFTWNFGDSGTSGTSTWLYGSNPNGNSRNAATGAIAAHLYITSGATTNYNATVTAFDGVNTASCTLAATAYDPSDATNGFAGTKTICQSSTGTPVAGSGGCPAGAAVSNSASEGTNINSSMNTKRVLFKCGDSFSGGVTAGGTKFSIGAYGSCPGTQTSRPIFSGGLTMSNATTDGRISDIDFESSGGSGTAFNLSTLNTTTASQITLWNLKTQGWFQNFYLVAGNQFGIVGANAVSFSNSSTPTEGSFLQYGENNCLNGVSPGPSDVYQCGQGSGAVYQNIAYLAVIGSHFGGPGTSTIGYETMRISACRLCVLTNSDYADAGGTSYSPFKFHSGNTWSSRPAWIGQYTELIELSDNLFYGNSGAQLVEICPQNAQNDERLRLIVIERNVFVGGAGANKSLALSALNATVRDNAFSAGTNIHTSVAKRGIEYTGTPAAPSNALAPEFIEIYNNTCNGGANCASFSTAGWTGPGNNSIARNILMYNAGGGTVVGTGGTGNTISNNTTSVTANPGFTNGSSTFRVISDFKPTANYVGGTNVPVWYDAVGAPWLPTWNLGEIKPNPSPPPPPGPRHRLLLSRLGIPIEIP